MQINGRTGTVTNILSSGLESFLNGVNENLIQPLIGFFGGTPNYTDLVHINLSEAITNGDIHSNSTIDIGVQAVNVSRIKDGNLQEAKKDSNGKPKQAVNPDGSPKYQTDENGNYLYQVVKDKNGNPVPKTDSKGNIIYTNQPKKMLTVTLFIKPMKTVTLLLMPTVIMYMKKNLNIRWKNPCICI